MAIVSAYRTHGHLAANLDPLGSPPPGDRRSIRARYGLTPSLMSAIPASVLHAKVPGNTLADVLPRLRETYARRSRTKSSTSRTSSSARWLRDYIESGLHRVKLTPERRSQVLGRLTKVETMERYLRKNFLGQKTFSIEGLDVMVPMLEEIISMLADDGTKTAVLGMAHRGRLATIAHVVNRPYEEILGEFEAAKMRGEQEEGNDATRRREVPSRRDGRVHDAERHQDRRAAAPAIRAISRRSNGVVEGADARAADRSRTPIRRRTTSAKPRRFSIHGDAAFPAQGVVAEVLNLAVARRATRPAGRFT